MMQNIKSLTILKAYTVGQLQFHKDQNNTTEITLQ